MHLFVHCSHVVHLWKSLEAWIYSSTRKRLIFSQENIILGYLYNDNNYYPINTIIAVTKSYIFSSAVHEAIPNISALKILKLVMRLTFIIIYEFLLIFIFFHNRENFKT